MRHSEPMDANESLELQGRLAQLSDEELIRILAVEQESYRQKAIHFVRCELSRRGLKELDAEEYLASSDQESIRDTGFCFTCIEETTDEAPGKAWKIFGIGTYLMGIDGGCPTCGSVVQTKYFSILNLPVRRLGRYRIVD